jgi:hypothetical protein
MGIMDIYTKGDTRFENTATPGDPDCICSRCGFHIRKGEIPVRLCSGTAEYRYHPGCVGVDYEAVVI